MSPAKKPAEKKPISKKGSTTKIAEQGQQSEKKSAQRGLRQDEIRRLAELSGQIVPHVKGSASSRALFPRMLLSPKQFDAIAKLIRSRDPARAAARLVLVEGMSISEAARSAQGRDGAPLQPQMVNNTVTRFKAAHTLIWEAYRPPRKPVK